MQSNGKKLYFVLEFSGGYIQLLNLRLTIFSSNGKIGLNFKPNYWREYYDLS